MRAAFTFLPPVILAVLMATLASPPEGRASTITSFDQNEPVALRLADGRQLTGRYRRMLGSPGDRTAYAERYETWRSTLGLQSAPALGESLVVTRKSADPVRGAFRGFTDQGLLLGTSDSCAHLVVRLDKHAVVRRAADPTADSDWIAARRQWRSAPSMYAFALKTPEGVTVAVPATMVTGRSALPRTRGETVAGVAIAVAVCAVLLAGAAVAAMASSFSQPMF